MEESKNAGAVDETRHQPDCGNTITFGSHKLGEYYEETAVNERGISEGAFTKINIVGKDNFSEN